MKTKDKIQLKIVAVNFIPNLSEMEDNTFYYSQTYNTSSHKCLCGCGQLAVTPINKRYGWNLDIKDKNIFTITPSILNPCGSHYVVTNGVANIL